MVEVLLRRVSSALRMEKMVRWRGGLCSALGKSFEIFSRGVNSRLVIGSVCRFVHNWEGKREGFS